eukprot:1258239-Amphidinium_carterae.1
MGSVSTSIESNEAAEGSYRVDWGMVRVEAAILGVEETLCCHTSNSTFQSLAPRRSCATQ